MESDPEFVNFGRSIIVPSAQELAKNPLADLPPRYSHSPPPFSTYYSSQPSIPVIGLRRRLGAPKIALRLRGFLPDHQPQNQLFVVSEDQKLDWSDMFYVTTLPHSLRKSQLFDDLPDQLRDVVDAYSAEVKNLALEILGHMAKALKMNEEEMRENFWDGVHSMRMNMYPRCPRPEITMGFSPHSDANALTILLQLSDSDGLQIRKGGVWIPVTPLPNAFVVNVGDIMDVYTIRN